MRATVSELAALVQGQVHGDAGRMIAAARPLQEAGADDISFLESEKNLRQLEGSQAAALVVPAALADRPELQAQPHTLVVVRDALTAFITIAQRLHGRPVPAPSGIDPRAVVHPSAIVGPDASVHAFAVIEEGAVIGARCRIHAGVYVGASCRIGDDVSLYPHVVLYEGTVLGHRVIVHANAVLGADGFGYRMQDGRHVKVPQLGHVEIGDDVEVGACTTIDRGTFQATRVGAGTKIDNLVQVAHNCRVGRHNLFVSQSGIAGSSITGDYVVLAGQVGIADHVHIHDRAMIGARASLFRDVPAGERMLGTPARPEREEKRIMLIIDKLPELYKDIKALKRKTGLDETGKGEAA